MRVVPVIPVAKEFVERLAKARAGLVQRRVQVKTRHGNHMRMQWVRPENDRAWGEKEQPGLFDDLSAAARKPEPKATPTPKENTKLAQIEDKIDQLKSRIKVTEKVGGTTAMLKKELADKEKEAKGLREQSRPAEHGTLIKPGDGGDRNGHVIHADGGDWLVMSSRANLVSACPIVNGKPEVNAESKKQFDLRESNVYDTGKKWDFDTKPAASATDALFDDEVMGKLNTVEYKPNKGTLSRVGKFFSILSKHYGYDEFPDRPFDDIFEMNDGDEVVVGIIREAKEKPYIVKDILYAGNFAKAPSVIQPKLLSIAGHSGPEIVEMLRDKYGYGAGLSWMREAVGRMKKQAKDAKYDDIRDAAEFAAEMYGRTVEKIDKISGGGEKPDAATEPTIEEMAKEAARWKGAALKVAQEIGDDKKAALNHSKMTIKADLDAYLQRKFGIGAVEAREVSNHLTDKNIPADMSASLEDFKDEPWYTNRPKPAETKETYENRKLGYQHARTSADDEYSTEAMAAIALSNMKTGERFPVGRTWYTVSNITDKMLTVTGEDGEKKTFKPSGSKWESLVRDVGGAILGSHHGVDAGDLVTAFMRDPAARREGGMLSIKDTIPPLKKSVVDLFREGLAKAFGTR